MYRFRRTIGYYRLPSLASALPLLTYIGLFYYLGYRITLVLVEGSEILRHYPYYPQASEVVCTLLLKK